MLNKTVIIIGISSDIGKALAKYYLADGFNVIGSYRKEKYIVELKKFEHLYLFQCDINKKNEVEVFARNAAELGYKWNRFISSVGTQFPVGNFFESDFDEFSNNIHVNFIEQLRILHGVHSFRDKSDSSAVFFAGPGSNGPAPCYSGLCTSKIALIKFAELLNAECKDMNVFTIGPGWVRTRTHEQTLLNPELAGENYFKTKKFMESGHPGTAMKSIYDHIEWCVKAGKNVAGGRNFSTVHDCWGSIELAKKLSSNENMYKLRRYFNDWKERVQNES